MKLQVLAFGIVKEIFGSSQIEVEMMDGNSVEALKMVLENQYPRLKQLASYRIAINQQFAGPADALAHNDEIAVIPPVSGG